MKLKNLLLVTLLFLSACSFNEEQPDNSQKEDVETIDESNNDIEENPEEPEDEIEEELSAEEQLALELPGTANLANWNLILVNPWEALPEDFTPDLVDVHNEQRIDKRIEESWDSLYQAALNEGHRLFFASGYRSIELQDYNFNQRIQEHMNNGLSEEEAIIKAKEYLTEPGHSEHHTGLALDIVDEQWIVDGHGLDPEYDTQLSQHWLIENMTEYGFILRYPEGKEEITGILYEPWHFRYVGKENAEFMIEHNLVLEEYVDLIILRDDLLNN